MKVEGCKFHTICMRELYDFMTSDEESSVGSFWGKTRFFLLHGKFRVYLMIGVACKDTQSQWFDINVAIFLI